jgi:hypothetical protein
MLKQVVNIKPLSFEGLRLFLFENNLGVSAMTDERSVHVHAGSIRAVDSLPSGA